MNKNYNYERTKLVLPEYGRHIQQMIAYLSTIEDRDLRTSMAHVVIDVMGNVNPILRDAADFKHKLWDHLFIISDFKLDVDSPYPTPQPNMMYPQPEKLSYPKGRIFRKHYGKNIENMLNAIKLIEDEEVKTAMTGQIAKYMRAKSYEYNQEYPNNEVIIKDIRAMSDNRIIIDEVAINSLKNDYKQPHSNTKQRKNFSSPSHSNGKSASRQNKNGAKRHQTKAAFK